MASDYDYLPASDGNGDAALAHITALRLTGATTITVDSITNFPSKFIGTYGTVLASGLIDPATKVDFKGHTSGGNIVIDGFEAGSTDAGNLASGQIVIVKPTTGVMNRIAQFIKNATNFGTPENLWAAILTAASAVLSGNLSVGGSLTLTGSETVGGNMTITGTSQLVAAVVTTSDGSNNLTPTKQVFNVTALAHDATVLVPTFTPVNGMTGELQILDNGTIRALTWPAGWVAIGVTLPTATVAGKYLYVSYRYNSVDTKWHVRGIARQA